MDRCTCFHCGGQLIWQSDYMADECGYDTYGIVHILYCPSCGAEVEYMIPMEEPNDGTDASED